VRKKTMKVIAGLLALFVTLPIWFYLLYRILDLVMASELMWFLYWVYVPVGIFVQLLVKFAEDD